MSHIKPRSSPASAWSRSRKPSTSAPYDDMARRRVRAALTDAGIDYDVRAAGLRRLGLRRLDLRSGRALRRRHERHPDRQRQQQLLDRVDGAVPRAPGGRVGAVDCVLAVGFEQMRRGALSAALGRPARPFAIFDEVSEQVQGTERRADGRALLRRRRRDLHRALRHDARDVREDLGQVAPHAANNPYAVFRDAVTVEQVLASPAIFDPLTRLLCCPPTCGRGRRDLLAGVRRRPRDSTRRRDPRPGDDHRHARARSTAATCAASSATTWPGGRREPGLRAGRHRPRGHPGRRAARLLHDERAAQLRGARADPRGHRGEVRRRRRQHLRRPRGHQPLRRPAVQGAPARARRAWRSAPS